MTTRDWKSIGLRVEPSIDVFDDVDDVYDIMMLMMLHAYIVHDHACIYFGVR